MVKLPISMEYQDVWPMLMSKPFQKLSKNKGHSFVSNWFLGCGGGG